MPVPTSGRAASAAPALEADGRLLIMLHANAGAEIAQALATLHHEGWNLLNIADAPDDDAAAVELLALVQDTLNEIGGAPKPVFVAEAGAAGRACRTLALWHRRGTLPRDCGLVAIDALDIAVDSLTEIETLATLIAASREATAARGAGLASHRALQARGRDSRFVAVADTQWAAQLADPAQPIGRELRWLLDPVHSRTDG